MSVLFSALYAKRASHVAVLARRGGEREHAEVAVGGALREALDHPAIGVVPGMDDRDPGDILRTPQYFPNTIHPGG